MARKKKTGTRHGSSTYQQLSATTFQTIGSGVTICEQGILYNSTTGITPTELGYLDGATGYAVGNSTAGYLISGGSAAWAGASISIATGLTTILALVGGQGDVSGASAASLEWVHNTGLAAGTVTAALMATDGASSVLVAASGGSLQWIAFGT